MKTSLVIAACLPLVLASGAHAQKVTAQSVELVKYLGPSIAPCVLDSTNTCNVKVDVSMPAGDRRCSAVFPTEVHIPNGVREIKILWQLNKVTSGDTGVYSFDPNYGIEPTVDSKAQLYGGVRPKVDQYQWTDRNSVPLSFADYLPHVLRQADINSLAVPCDVKDPKIVND